MVPCMLLLTASLSLYLFFGSLEASFPCRALTVVFLSLPPFIFVLYLHSFFQPSRCFSRQLLLERPIPSSLFTSKLTQLRYSTAKSLSYLCALRFFAQYRVTDPPSPAINPLYRYRMPSNKLMGFWWFFNFTLFAAGAVSVALSIVWGRPDLLMNITTNSMDLKRTPLATFSIVSISLTPLPYRSVGLIMGILFLVTWVISIGAVIQKNHVTVGLICLNVVLLLDMLYVLVLGSLIWVLTLHELVNFHQIYSEQTPAIRIAIQDMVSSPASSSATFL